MDCCSSTNTESSSTVSNNTYFQEILLDNGSETKTFIRTKLTEWGLFDYIEIFEREKIDKSVFLSIPDEAVAKLIQPMGHYYRFIFERQKYITSNKEKKPYSKVSETSGKHLRSLLKQTVEGKYLLKQSSILRSSNYLAKIIIDHLLNKENKLKGKSASGKLYYYYTNKLRKIKAAVTEFNREETEHIEKQIEEEADVYISELNNTSLDDKKKILSLWEKTFVYRTKANGKNIAEYFDGYPQLRPPLGIQLIELDFKLLNIAQIDILGKKWPVLHPNIIRLAKKQPTTSNLLKDFKKVPADVQAWLVLPYLFKPVLKKTGLKKPWKPSYKEQSDGFITWINVITDIEKVISTHRTLMSDYKLTLQPFVIVVLSKEKVAAAYVIINDEKYQFQDVTNAIAFCWKSFFVLNAAYPVSCEAIWIYIEEEIYECKKTKSSYQSVKWFR
ncbi:PREDICTED: uncharacterized protein LOC108761280 [Trachymyrmex cornetzi]|uniref:uncharacterized protein LOC108761280 n=1 Tax=Trachymyrmex cornetzi TaxID=471704 RepID=UPI00084EDA10|nr:PREDICTED: uncharacterized protein LOC108761280 [Trachymyrmex cornetzi]